MRRFLIAGVLLGFTVTANGQVRGRYHGDTFLPIRNLVITFDPAGRRVELRVAEASSPSSRR